MKRPPVSLLEYSLRRCAMLALPLLATSLFPGGLHAAGDSEKKPNVVLFYIDDLDFDEIGAYDSEKFPSPTGAAKRGFAAKDLGGEFTFPEGVSTPNLDKLAASGMRMDRFYVTSPICTPSRYGLLTGRYASGAPQIMDADGPEKPGDREPLDIMFNIDIAPSEMTIEKIFRQNGYRTGLVGKWHNSHFLEMGTRLEGLEEADPADPAVVRQIADWYEKSVEYLKTHFDWDYVGALYTSNPTYLGLPKSLMPTQDNLEWTTDAALRFLDESKNRPFFLYYAMTAPHGTLRTDFLEKANPRGTAAGLWDKAFEAMPPRRTTLERLREKGISDAKAAMGLWIDDAVGALVNRIRELGLEKDTIIIFISDHQTRGKFALYEGARVPALFSWSGHIPAGTTSDSLVANIDVPITLADLCNLQTPKDWKQDGISFAETLLAEKDSPRQDLLLEAGVARGIVTESGWKYIALRIPKEKEAVIHYTGDWGATPEDRAAVAKNPGGKGPYYRNPYWFPHCFDSDQLYDLNTDPYEQVNLADDPATAGRLAKLRKRLAVLLRKQPGTFAEFSP